MDGIRIGKLAKITNVNIETIRFYEKKGLLPTPARKKIEFGTHPGFKLFSTDTVKRIEFIKRLKNLGFTLKEIGKLLDIADGKETKCDEIYKFAQAKKKEVNSKIDELRKIKKMLDELSKSCSSNSDLSVCPIIESLTD